MSPEWLFTLIATVLAVVMAMLGLGVGILLGRSGPVGSCGGELGGACSCGANTGVCTRRGAE